VGTLYRLDVNSGQLEVVDSYAVPIGRHTREVAGLVWDGRYLWIGNQGADVVCRVDPAACR